MKRKEEKWGRYEVRRYEEYRRKKIGRERKSREREKFREAAKIK